MITSKILMMAAMVSTLTAAPAQSFHPATAGKETSTRPWTAPVGHRQPHASDIPATGAEIENFLDREDAEIDRKIRGVCRGC